MSSVRVVSPGIPAGQGEANEGDSSVNPLTVQVTAGFPPSITVSNNYNFAIARVRLRRPPFETQ